MLLALSVGVEIFLAEVLVVVISVEAIETHLCGLLAGVIVLTWALDGKHESVYARFWVFGVVLEFARVLPFWSIINFGAVPDRPIHVGFRTGDLFIFRWLLWSCVGHTEALRVVLKVLLLNFRSSLAMILSFSHVN